MNFRLPTPGDTYDKSTMNQIVAAIETMMRQLFESNAALPHNEKLTISVQSLSSDDTTETVRVKAIDPRPGNHPVDAVAITYAADGVGGITPASGPTLTPTDDMDTTGHVDFVITRGAVGTDQGTVVFTASRDARIPDVASLVVTARRQTQYGPSMDIQTTPHDTTIDFEYTYDGVFEWSVNGAAFTAPPASPFSRNRPAVNSPNDIYVFQCTKDGQTMQDSISVPSKGDIPDIDVAPAGSTATTASYTVTVKNHGGGTAPTIALTLSGVTAVGYSGSGPFAITSGTTVVFNRPAFGSGQNSAVFTATIAGGSSTTETLHIANEEQDTQYALCHAHITSSTATQCTVQVDATAVTGSPTVQLVSITGPATLSSGAAIGTPVAAGSSWVFNLGDYAHAGVGTAVFLAHQSGIQDEKDTVVLANTSAQPALDISWRELSETATTLTIEVTVADPYPQGAGSITLSVSALNNATATESGTPVTTSSTWTINPGTSKTFVVTRPDFGSGKGAIQWKATATGRTPDYADLIVTEKLRDTISGRLSLSKASYNYSTGNYELWFRYFVPTGTGTETEVTSAFAMSGTLVLANFDIRDVHTGASAGATFHNSSTPPNNYNSTVPGWRVTWASTPMQSWSFHMDLSQIALDWTGVLLSPIPGATLDTIINAPNLQIGGLNPKLFGVVGDGVTPDADAVQAAFTAGAVLNKFVDFGSMVCVLEKAVTCTGPGFRFDTVSGGGAGQPGFLVTGTGYTALTIANTIPISTLQGTVYASGQAVNLIYLNNPQQVQGAILRASNANGFGIKIDMCWDCTFTSLSVESCGNTSEYAFSMNHGTDSCNMTHIAHLQVESAYAKAIYMDPSNIACTIGVIHSENHTPVVGAAYNGWDFDGSTFQYACIRLSSNDPTNAKVRLAGACTSYTNLRIEGAGMSVGVDSIPSIDLYSPSIDGNFHENTGNGGRINVFGGRILNRTGTQTNIIYNGTL